MTSWYLIDAKDQVLGRLATVSSKILTGKNLAVYTPSQIPGDHLIIINVKQVAVTGRREAKLYRHHTGFPGGLKETNLGKLRATYPDRIVRSAVRGMLPKNKLNARMLKNLHIFAGAEHGFDDKKPIEVNLG